MSNEKKPILHFKASGPGCEAVVIGFMIVVLILAVVRILAISNILK
jgi:hypothetical protein